MHCIVRLALALSLAAGSVSSAAAPFERARTLDGSSFQATGQVTIINYWATWCVPCRAEMPVLDAFYRKHREDGLALLAVSLDNGVSASRLKQLTSQFAFPVARIGEVRMPRRDIPVGLPVTRIYDKAGRLRFQAGGDGRTGIDEALLERIVLPLLAER